MHTLEALVTGARKAIQASALLILHLGTLQAAAAHTPNFSSRTGGIWRALYLMAGHAGQRQAVLHQQDDQKLTDQQPLQIHCGAETEE
ncbi:hypothetical protein PGIGA_G00171510, partial [Pangasianodon gigas]|nr:hypothetical protein [Pangasianodon gigas]